MAQVAIPRARKEARNTYRLPQGEPLRRELVRWFRRQRDVILRWLSTGKKDVGGQDLPGQFPDFDWFGLGNLPMSERMTPHIEATWDTAGQQFTAKIGLDPDSWEVTNPKTQEAIDNLTLDFCEETNASTTLELNDALAKTREELGKGIITHGESVADLTKRVKKVFTAAETWRARRIATSETSRAVHAAQVMQGDASGVVTGWKWLLSEDACPLCQTVARRAPQVKVGQAFAIVGDNPAYSTIKHPPLHPQCQCALEPVLDIDHQPKWSETLHQPEPEEEDYAEGEAPEKVRGKPKRPAPPKLPKRKPDADLVGVEQARSAQRQANADAARTRPIYDLPRPDPKQAVRYRESIEEQRRIIEKEKRDAEANREAFEKLKAERQRQYEKATDWKVTPRTRQKWDKLWKGSLDEYYRLNSIVEYAPQRIKNAEEMIEYFERTLKDIEAAEKLKGPIKVNYAANLAIHPNLIPPGPIQERIAAYKIGDAKIEAMEKIGLRYERQEVALATKRSELTGKIDVLLNRQAEVVTDAIARDGNASSVHALVDEIQKQLEALTIEKDKIKAAQKELSVKRAGDIAKVIKAEKPMEFTWMDSNPGTMAISQSEKVSLTAPTPGTVDAINEGLSWLSKVTESCDGDFAKGMKLKIGESAGARAHCAWETSPKSDYHVLLAKDERPATVVHEFGHAIDSRVKTGEDLVLKRSLEFKEYRLKGEKPIQMSNLYKGYEDHEMGAQDEFWKAFGHGSSAYYCGKDYKDSGTEIISMGVELLFKDPLVLAKRDPEYCKFILGILDGSLR